MAAKDEKSEKRAGQRREEPVWARGLRDLYDEVVDEPLPDNFKDLLDKLDSASGDGASK